MFDLSSVLRGLRKQAGYTQRQVASKLNVALLSVARWEKGDVRPPTERLIELAVLFNIPINTLLGTPLENQLSIDGLSARQQELIRAIVKSFTEPSGGDKVPKGLSAGQQQIIAELLREFSS